MVCDDSFPRHCYLPCVFKALINVSQSSVPVLRLSLMFNTHFIPVYKVNNYCCDFEDLLEKSSYLVGLN